MPSLTFIKKIYFQIILIGYFTFLSLIAQAALPCTSEVNHTNIPLQVIGKNPSGADIRAVTINLSTPNDTKPSPDSYDFKITHRCPYRDTKFISNQLVVDIIYDGKYIQDYYANPPRWLLDLTLIRNLYLKDEKNDITTHKGNRTLGWDLFTDHQRDDLTITTEGFGYITYQNYYVIENNFSLSNNFKTMSIVIIKPPEPMTRVLYLDAIQTSLEQMGPRPTRADATLQVTVNLPVGSNPDKCSAKVFKITAPDVINFGAIRKSEVLKNSGYQVSRPFDISIHKATSPTEKCTQDITPKIYFDMTSEKLASSYTTAELKNGLAIKIKHNTTGQYVNLNNEGGISGPEISGNQDNTTVKTSFTAELTKASSAKEIIPGKFEATLRYIIEFP